MRSIVRFHFSKNTCEIITWLPPFSRWVDSKIKVEVTKFTSKDYYQFGDLTKEIMNRVASGKYTMDDLFMLLKALAMIGASLSPVGK